MEAVLLSTPISYLKVLEEKGFKSAKTFLKLKTNIDNPLSAILSLNTIAHTIGAAGVGAQAVKVFGDAYFGIISAILTILILVLTEIIPKTIGARYWRNLALASGEIIKILIFITYPLVLISGYIMNKLSKNKNIKTTSREEISALANIGVNEGIFGEKENKIIQNLIRLKNIKVSDIMTPRVVVTVANEDITIDEFLENKTFINFSRIPIYSESPENITGYIIRQSIINNITENNTNIKLKDIKREIVIIHDSTTIFNVWEILLNHKEHIALVVDEYGGMDGIVTMEDIIESLLGIEIIDEKDTISNMQEYARERWKMRQLKYDILKNKNKK
jgi:CBS domain containing-hemolysin-like protein